MRFLGAGTPPPSLHPGRLAFGQEDDVTVLTLTRLATGETSVTLLNAPVLAGS
jgi:hypothetical protein